MITKRGTLFPNTSWGISIALVENYWDLLPEFLEGTIEQILLGEQTEK